MTYAKRRQVKSWRRTVRARAIAKSKRIHGRKKLDPKRIRANRALRKKYNIQSRGDVRRAWALAQVG
jgi:hypothetical protein